jgi:serine/threonine protein kinase
MPAPATPDELLDLIQKSGVVDEAKLRNYVQKLKDSSSFPADPAKLAGVLVRDGILTYFQAEQLLQGKYKRFSIGKYKVLEKLGAGGMAQVFLCEHKLMRRRVAIKVLPTAKAEDESSLQRFYREARAVAAVDHPNIVRAYDIDQDENLHFLVMEYVDGTNLHDLVKKFGPLDITRACHYIYGAAVGLQHAHEMGLIHRDIKPGNILIERSGVVKILDMGLARFFHDSDDALTKQYDENVLGTADYLAPEQALDSHTVDTRADIYSLGATFYYLLTGSALFPEGSVAQKLIWHQNRQPRPLRSLRPDVPEEITAIVERMMAKDVANRYQTHAEVMAALSKWVSIPIQPPSEREMPQLSPAAGGSPRGPASMTLQAPAMFGRGGGPSSPDAPTVVGPVPTTMTSPGPYTPTANIPTVAQPQSAGPFASPNVSPVWETLDSDTQTVAQADTQPTGKSEPISRTRHAKKQVAAPPKRGKAVLLLVLLGVLVLCGSAAGVYYAFFTKTTVPEPPVQTSRRITVSSTPGDNSVGTLREALSRATAGDTIVIAEAKVSEPGMLRLDRNRHKDLVIEGGLGDGKVPVVEFMGKAGVMLDVTSVEGLHIKNLEFDGKNTATTAIQVSGVCPGVQIEHVTVRNMKQAGIILNNIAGDANRPITLDHVRFSSCPGDGILLNASTSLDNKRAVIRNSRVDGPCQNGIHVEGAATDVEITCNRLFGCNDAIAFGKPPTGKVIKVSVTSNTIYQCGIGVHIDLAPPPPVPNVQPQPLGKYELTINHNYFARTRDVAKVEGVNGPVPGVATSDNGTGPETGGGNGAFSLIPVASSQLASTNPSDDDAKFLRFAGGPPEVGPNRVRVGAP